MTDYTQPLDGHSIPHSEDAKERISQSLRDRYAADGRHPRTGMKHSEEVKARIRLATKERFADPELRNRMSRAKGGKEVTLINNNLGITETITGSRKDFCDKYNLAASNLSNLIRGKLKTYKGWALAEVKTP